jgi:hypothetical protein
LKSKKNLISQKIPIGCFEIPPKKMEEPPPTKKQKINPTDTMEDVEYDFEYEDDFEENEEENISIENEYYIAKAEENPNVSKILFEDIISMKNEK